MTRTSPPIELGDLSLHVWRVQRSLRNLFRQRLTRVATYRLGATPQTRSFTPAKGIGVVGLCWKYNEEKAVDVEALCRTLTGQQEYEKYRASQGTDSVMGFTWPEFKRVSHRGAVLASPIRNRQGRFVGCISVDAKSGFDRIDVQNFWHELNSLCFKLGQGELHFV